MIAADASSGAVLTLFVTGDAPRSRRARDNLQQAMTALGCEPDALREVDLLEHPGCALDEGIFATPALLRRAARDADGSVLYGDLSDAGQLRRFLADVAPNDAPR